MIDNSILIAILAILAINYIYNQYIETTKDVHEIYLSEQSIIDATRLPNESAIYKSNKLDYSNGLRVGLDIRYDHYKLRNGNLCDIWELLINHVKVNEDKAVEINGKQYLVSELNYKVKIFEDYLIERQIKTIGIHFKHFLRSDEVLIILVSCFINQITVNFYDNIANVDGADLFAIDQEQIDEIGQDKVPYILLGSTRDNSVSSVIGATGKLTTFKNEYTFIKDKGVAIKLTRMMNNKVISNVEFSQINLISSLASTLKHLPINQEINGNDKLVIVQSFSNNEEFLNDLVKVLISFVTHCDLVITDSSDWNFIKSLNPTILSLTETNLTKILPLEKLKQQLNMLEKIMLNQKFKLLSRGKFSNFKILNSSLRLIYLNKTLKTNMRFTSFEINQYRSLLNCRIILEFGYYNIVGSILQTDFYDYRLFSIKNNKLKGFGCLSQSIEIKLSNYKNNYGNALVRGYTIGKTSNALIGVGNEDENKHMKLNNGFMPLPNINGKWGKDGCLYVYN